MLFQIDTQGSYKKERTGKLMLKRGVVETPVFMPVGTLGMIKTLSPNEINELDFKLILSNTYHLYLQPGIEVLKEFKGLHNFVNWDKNLLTDSGGFQVFSLSSLTKVLEEGIEFKSHLDGSKHLFSPQKVLDIQNVIGSEIMMPIDQCTPPEISKKEAHAANERTVRWAKESKTYLEQHIIHNRLKPPSLFAITQGNFFFDIRKISIDSLVELDFEGYAIGGVSVGEDKTLTNEIIDFSTDHLPINKPRYLMGVGKPGDLIHGVEAGIDMFDSVYPTRVGRNATVFTRNGPLILRNQTNKFDSSPIEKDCECYTCKNFSRAYLRHLFKSKELLALRLASYHNLYFIKTLMDNMRKAISEDCFKTFKENHSALL